MGVSTSSDAPVEHHTTPPYRVADDTWVIGQLHRPSGASLGVHRNSLVITGAQPALVDTGAAAARASWLDDAWSLVDPTDVRWVFLSHEEPDHAGNLLEVLTLCPNATLVTSRLTVQRLSALHPVPWDRCRWVDDGDTFDVGDRVLEVVRPPVYDAPTTLGLLDRRTGVYWAADAFSTPVQDHVEDARDLPSAVYADGFLTLHRLISPWHTMVEPALFGATVERIRSLQPDVVASAHGPATSGARLREAYSLLHRLRSAAPADPTSAARLQALLSPLACPPPRPVVADRSSQRGKGSP